MIKKISILILLLISINSLFAQSTANRWIGHFSYNDITDLIDTEEKIYIATNNAVYIHNLATKENNIFTTVDGLSGNQISTIFVINDTEEELIFIGYNDGLLEILNVTSGDVRTVADIIIQGDLPQDALAINNFSRNGDIIYVAADFGIVEYSLTLNNFRDTFKFPDNSNGFHGIYDVATINNSIIASLKNNEIKQGSLTSNLNLSSSWTTVQNLELTELSSFENKLFGFSNNSIFEFDSNDLITPFRNSRTLTEDIKNIIEETESFNIITNNTIFQFDQDLSEIQNISLPAELANNVNFSSFDGENLLISDTSGLSLVENRNFNELTSLGPDGPSSNNVFRVETAENILWLIYGRYDRSFETTLSNLGPSLFSDNKWKNFEPEGFVENTVLSSINIDPNDKDHVFITGHRSPIGLYEFQSGEVINRFSASNSNLEFSRNVSGNRTSLLNTAFDENGDLWVINAEIDKLLKRFSTNVNNTNDNFHVIDLTDLSIRASDLAAKNIEFDEQGNIYIGSRRNGIIGYQPRTKNSVIFNKSDEDGVPFSTPTAFKIDITNNLWIGTTIGLRVVNNITGIFTNDVENGENIVIDGDNGVPQELLLGVSITDIEVDADNNKWIATDGSGVFFLSPNGQETFNVFTKENSPLPSNIVNDISIDKSDGSVYIATQSGLMQFESVVIPPEPDFSKFKIFPNPVRPEYGDVSVQIQGLTAGALVKITDIAGNLVYEIQNPVVNGSGSGAVTWDTRSFSGKKVASGVYLALISDKDGEQTKIGKLLIVR